jgi:type II secretory pathway pseudopilin PulG
MATTNQSLRTGIQVVLGIVIIGLAYFLYESITEPYQRIERQQELTERTRARMTHIRTALIDYERDSASFPDSLDLLAQHVRRDSFLSNNPDSAFGGPINVDSLLHSPRTGTRFRYTVNDTGRVETYLLEDPDTDDQIGTLSGDVTETNVASWE